MFQTLIEPQQLFEHLDDPDWCVIDCSFDLADPEAGQRAFLEGHIPGAVYAHLERDLSGPVGEKAGRHPLPDAGALIAKLSGWGVGPATQVIACDDANGAMAARLWWLLGWLGHENVAVLNGGLAAWREAGLPLVSEASAPAAARFERRSPVRQMVSADEVLDAVEGRADWRLVDARAPERYLAKVEPIDAAAGHIPAALNRPFMENLDAASRFLPAGELRARFQGIAAGRADRVVHYCGSGVTACHNLLAMEIAGLPGSRLYPGSWSEWITDPDRPRSQG